MCISKYTHTHTHTHIYIYTCIYIYIYIYAYYKRTKRANKCRQTQKRAHMITKTRAEFPLKSLHETFRAKLLFSGICLAYLSRQFARLVHKITGHMGFP